MSRGWLAPMTLALLCATSGWSTTASAQEASAPNNKLVFAVVVNRIFNQGQLALVDDFVAMNVTNNGTPLGRNGFKALVRDLRGIAPDFKLTIDDVMARGDRVIGHLTQRAGGVTESRTMLLRIEGGLVQEHWTWTAPSRAPYWISLRADGAQQPAAPAN